MPPPPPRSTLFPYTTLFRSEPADAAGHDAADDDTADDQASDDERGAEDRKSTRLNSSHLGISYAVFCLKKKTTTADVDGTHASAIPGGPLVTPQGDQGQGPD